MPEPDAGRDGSRVGPREAGPDVGRDTGLPSVPVLPRQSWEMTVSLNQGDGETVRAALALDARAESGSVRAVFGANGRSSNVVFQIPRPGTLTSAEPLEFGPPLPLSDCAARGYQIGTPTLTFADRDADGIFETLTGLTGELLRSDSPGMFADFGAVGVSGLGPDEREPTLFALPSSPIGGLGR